MTSVYPAFARVVCLVCGVGLGVGLGAAGGAAQAQNWTSAYYPNVGQVGKDVVWVPTAQTLVDRMLDMAKVTPADFVVDLGSGDGRTVISAAQRGARALGIEFDRDLVEMSRTNAEKAGVAALTTFVQGDFFQTDFSQASVLTLFLLPHLNLQLRPKILAMKPGTRVVSNSFDMGDWKPDETDEVSTQCTSWCRSLFWIVPADVSGSWALPQGRLALRQNYQMISGTLTVGGKASSVAGRVRGTEVALTADGRSYAGKLTDAGLAFDDLGTATRTGR
jgi:SAM-dependent methyltransferase